MSNTEKSLQVYHEILRREFYCRRGVEGLPLGLQCEPHLHSDIELLYLENGSLTAFADTTTVELKSGDVFISFPNQIHYFRSADHTESYMLFIIKPTLLPEYLDFFSCCAPSSPLIRNARELPRVDALFQMLWQSEKDDTLSPSQAAKRRCGYLLALISELLLHMDIQVNNGEDSNSMRAIIRYCSEHFSENLSLSSLEEALHLNKYYISHLFSKKLGIPFNDYVNSLRISEACRLLLNTGKSITDISEAIGFNTLRTFNRAFTKQIGLSPSQYRKADPAVARSKSYAKTATPSRIIGEQEHKS